MGRCPFGVDLVHDCVDDLRVVGTYDNGLNKIVERMRQARMILIRQKINLIAGLPQLGSSEIGIKVKVPLYVVRKIGITKSAAEGDARHQLRCHPRTRARESTRQAINFRNVQYVDFSGVSPGRRATEHRHRRCEMMCRQACAG